MDAKLLLPFLTAGVVWLCAKKYQLSRTVTILLLAAAVLAGGAALLELRRGAYREVTGLSETEAGEDIPLVAETADGKHRSISLQKPEHKATPEEQQKSLEAAAAQLETSILGQNKDLQHVCWNLQLPTDLPGGAITASWTTTRSDLLGWNGELLAGIPEEGAPVQIQAILYLDDQMLQWQRQVRVYPSREKGALQSQVQRAYEESGQLPEEVNGKRLHWLQKNEQPAVQLCLLLILMAALSGIVKRKREAEAEELRRRRLARAYPGMVSKLQLLLAAGLSMRRAIARLGKEYPEMAQTAYEMENGVMEQDALAHFGERCGTPEYRRLSVLLAQCQVRGGQQLAVQLEQEVQEAFEGRRRSARTDGERASIRMLFPMLMMLAVVMVIIMASALLAL